MSEVIYSYNKRKNLVVFFSPVKISKIGTVVIDQNPIIEVRHLIHQENGIETLGYLDTIYIENKRISQLFFPIGKTVGISRRSGSTDLKSGKVFRILSVIDKNSKDILTFLSKD